MAFNTTINYTQNVPISFGFNNYFAPTPARQVTATFILDQSNIGGLNYATVNVPEVTGVSIRTGRAALNSSGGGSIILSGDVTAVNTCLNGCLYQSIYYSVEDIEQDVLAVDRNPGNYKGELQIQIPTDSNITGLNIGSEVTFSTILTPDPATDQLARFTITKIDSASSPIRVWMIYNRDYNLSEISGGSAFNKLNINTDVTKPCYFQTIARVNIGPVIDLAFGNSQGTIQIGFQTIDGPTENNTFTMVGKPQIAEPTFSTLPPTSALATSGNAWNTLPQMGTVAQTDNNYLTIQLLIKALDNDPNYLDVASYDLLPGYPTSGTEIQKLQFIGDKIEQKASLSIPKYIKDNSYGLFGDAQVDRNASISYPKETQEVKWSFFGIPSECNLALGRVFYWRHAGNTKDFLVETRIITSKARIYNKRGK